MTHPVILLLGSNVEPRLSRLDAAKAKLSSILKIEAYSAPVFSADITGKGPQYANIVIKATTDLTRAELEALISSIEYSLGRTKRSKYDGHMPIDIDLVIYDQSIISEVDYQRPYFKKAFHSMNF